MKAKIDHAQVNRVMKLFKRGRLRDTHGKTITDYHQALAVALNEGRSGLESGLERRTWHGRTRIRPRLKKQ